MKRVYLAFFLFFIASELAATEKLWIPMGTPVGSTIDAIQATPDAQGTPVLMANPNPQPTGTVVPGHQVKNGFWVYSYPDGRLESEGNYALGKKDGVWKYYWPTGGECREVEFKNGAMTGNVVLWAPDGSQEYYNNFTSLIQNVVPSDFKVNVLLPYWIDLEGNGNHELLVIARSDQSSMVLVLDSGCHLLDSKTFDGWVDDFIFGKIKGIDEICFGYDIACDVNLGVCQWEFDIWNGTNIKTVLQYQGWYRKNTPIIMPVFKQINGQTDIVTDNGTFQWDGTQESFKKISN